MENALGVTEKQASLRGARRTGGQELWEDAVEVDEISEATKNVARDRYQRLFWEPVMEGQVRLFDPSIYLCAPCNVIFCRIQH